jgi:hypothetical protein
MAAYMSPQITQSRGKHYMDISCKCQRQFCDTYDIQM